MLKAAQLENLRYYVKKALSLLGLYHPSLGIKIKPEAKFLVILAHKGSLKVFVETGTYKGDMIERVENHFEKIYSIELDKELCQNAKNRFAEDQHVNITHGNSGEELKRILSGINEPTLFWLDAHSDGDINLTNSPIKGELDAIFGHSVKNHVILIDDARHFDLPTIRYIKGLAKLNNYSFRIKDGIFRIYPKSRTYEQN